MRKSVVFASVAIAFLCQLALIAKDAPKVEIFGGYQYQHRPGADFFKGWNASVVGNVSDTFGIVADLGGSFKTVKASGISADVTVYSLLFGPRFHSRYDSVTSFFHFLAGYSEISSSVDVSGFSGNVGASLGGFAMATGGGFDVNVSEKIALRLMNADWMVSKINGCTKRGFRLSFGINFLIQ